MIGSKFALQQLGADMSDLPKGWVETSLGQIVRLRREKSAPITIPGAPYIGLEDIEAHTSKILRVGKASEVRSQVSVFKEGDVLYSRLRPYLNKVVVSPFDGVASAEVFALVPNGATIAEFVMQRIKMQDFLNFAALLDKGDRPRVSFSGIETFPINLPPLIEQKRIVAKLDKLISRTASARDALDHIPVLIDKQKSLLLEKAFSEWIDIYYDVNRDNLLRRHEILIGDLVENIVAGKNLRCEERPPSVGEKGVVKVSAVTWGKFDPLASKTLPPSFEPPEKSRIQNGDLLISRANTLELVGAVVIVDGCPENLYLSDKVLRLEMPEDDKRWLMWFLRSPNGRKEIEARASGNQVSMRNLSQKQLREIPFPWPAPNVRREIVRRIETAFAWLDRVSDKHIATSRLLPLLNASILQAAFSGELVNQNLNDEPASILLERIKAEREEMQAKTEPGRKAVARSQKPIKRGARMTDLIEVLKSKADWVSASNAAQALGIGDGATSDVVEEFYNELRMHLQNGHIEVERRGDEDWLRLMPISAE